MMTELSKQEPETENAFALLSRPTLDLTDAQVTAICKELRKRREAFLAGRKDSGTARKPASKLDDSPEAKKARTQHLLQDLGDLL